MMDIDLSVVEDMLHTLFLPIKEPEASLDAIHELLNLDNIEVNQRESLGDWMWAHQEYVFCRIAGNPTYVVEPPWNDA